MNYLFILLNIFFSILKTKSNSVQEMARLAILRTPLIQVFAFFLIRAFRLQRLRSVTLNVSTHKTFFTDTVEPGLSYKQLCDSFINLVSHSLKKISSKDPLSQTVRARELTFERMFNSPPPLHL